MSLTDHDVEALASLTQTLERLSNTLGSDHPAVLALTQKISAIAGVQSEAQAPEETEICQCAGCALTKYLFLGHVDGETRSLFELQEALWLECEGDAVVYTQRFEAALSEVREKSEELKGSGHPDSKMLAMGILLRSMELLSTTHKLDSKYPEIQENWKKQREAAKRELTPELKAAMLDAAPPEVKEAIARGAKVEFINAESAEGMAKILAELEARGATRH